MFAFDIIKREANEEYLQANYDRACRKYEEALSIFRYFICFNPKWQEEGINDSQIQEYEDMGKTEYEK